MKKFEDKSKNVKIAYIGGGSRGWAWGLMSDLAVCEKLCGEIALYDIDYEAAYHNEIIGNQVKDVKGCKSAWRYRAVSTIKEALTGADFVVISIQPATFKEMGSDVHTPEKYGLYQSVGDTTGPGGIIRALRTIPMYEVIGHAIRDYSPNAWVINYTNPMTVCVKTLYRVFPKIKAFGCCHEVFGTQKLLAKVLDEMCGIKDITRPEIKVNVVGVNHFTWLTEAHYKNIDIFPIYRAFVEKFKDIGYTKGKDNNWMNNTFACSDKVKMDLFRRYGVIAAAGDRHLAEFCPGYWYLESPEKVKEWGFGLTPITQRTESLKNRLARSERLRNGEEKFEFKETGEDGVKQMCALLGIADLKTNVNIPNIGQIPNMPYGAVVETNAYFSDDSVRPVMAGNLPESIYALVNRIAGEQECIVEAGLTRNLELAFEAFVNDPLVYIPLVDARKLFDEMIDNTKEYLGEYFE